jgi:hypothetical protein
MNANVRGKSKSAVLDIAETMTRLASRVNSRISPRALYASNIGFGPPPVDLGQIVRIAVPPISPREGRHKRKASVRHRRLMPGSDRRGRTDVSCAPPLAGCVTANSETARRYLVSGPGQKRLSFIESTPEHSANAQSVLKCAPPIKHSRNPDTIIKVIRRTTSGVCQVHIKVNLDAPRIYHRRQGTVHVGRRMRRNSIL